MREHEATAKAMISDEKIQALRSLCEHFEARKSRAHERLRTEPDGRLYFGILGLSTEAGLAEYRFDDDIVLRSVLEPPGVVELAAGLRDKSLLAAVGRYAPEFTFELVVPANFGAKPEAALTLGWWLVSLLRVRSLADILVPAVSSQSWSTIAAVQDAGCDVHLLEDVPRAFRLDAKMVVTGDHLNWVCSNLVRFAAALEVPRFRLAVDALSTHQHEASLRTSTASLWAGIEAIFAVTTELRFRLAALAATYLEERGPTRFERYRTIKKLYDFRSKAVHGEKLGEQALREHVSQVRILLSALICKMVAENTVPTPDDFENRLFQ